MPKTTKCETQPQSQTPHVSLEYSDAFLQVAP